MKERINNIMQSEDPCGQDIKNLDTQLPKLESRGVIFSLILAFIFALIVSLLFAEAYNDSHTTDVTLLGIHFWIDNDNFLISPFMVFCYIFIILNVSFNLIWLVLIALLTSIQANCAKGNLLNNTYRTAQLLELIVSSMADNNEQIQQPDPASQSPELNTPGTNAQAPHQQNTNRTENVHQSTHVPDIRPITVADASGHIICPTCGLEQNSNRRICFGCGYEFKFQ